MQQQCFDSSSHKGTWWYNLQHTTQARKGTAESSLPMHNGRWICTHMPAECGRINTHSHHTSSGTYAVASPWKLICAKERLVDSITMCDGVCWGPLWRQVSPGSMHQQSQTQAAGLTSPGLEDSCIPPYSWLVFKDISKEASKDLSTYK